MFLSPDPYKASGGPKNPGSWNQYAYVQGDPINFNDPHGQDICFVGDDSGCGFSFFPIFDFIGIGRGGDETGQDRRADQIEECIGYEGRPLIPNFCKPFLAAAAIAATPRAPKESDCNSDVTPASIDAYLASKGSDLAGLGYVFVGFGRDYNVDPRFIVALAGAETTFGKNITWGSNNAWNWGWNGGDRQNSPFISYAYGIQQVTYGIRRLYLNRYKTSTFSIYLGGYCHGAACFQDGLRNLDNFLTEQGGNVNDLTFPCSKDN